jgi:hypothetical protein
MEVFKDIIGYKGLYQISNLGNVKSLPKKRFNGNHYINRKENIRKPIMSKKGYLSVGLYDNDYNLKLIKIHKLVATAFLENTDNGTHINHINGIKNDNRVDNLEWCTASENTIHAYKNYLMKQACIILDLNTGIYYNSIREISRYCNYSSNHLTNMLNGKRPNKTSFIKC